MTRAQKRSPLAVIFITVLIDLIGFGMVFPLIGLYGKHYGASGIQLAILGGTFSLMQAFFAPLWGALSDRVGRRPVLLFSLAGSTASYLIFALSPTYLWLLVSRTVGGIFAANISTAQAYIADITPPAERARGMGLIGAAFGIGFTLGPPLGGIASAKLGLPAPGLIAAAICGSNLLLAFIRLPESLPREKREKPRHRTHPLQPRRLLEILARKELGFLLLAFFAVTFAFSNLEQTFTLLFQNKFDFETGDAGYKAGLVLMVTGLLGAVIQGGLIRKLVSRFGEASLFMAGLVFNFFTMAVFPYIPTYPMYFLLGIPMAIGNGLVNPTLSAMISKAADEREQGAVMGVSQGLSSLARAMGPFCGLLTFAIQPHYPYWIGASLTLVTLFSGILFFQSRLQRR